MNLEKIISKKIRNTIAAVAMSSFIFACHHTISQTIPTPTTNPTPTQPTTPITPPTSGYDYTPTVKITDSQLVTAETGASIEVKDSTSFIQGTDLIIPSGALTSNETISIGRVDNPPALPSGLNFVGAPIDLEPEGINFNHPLTIKIPYKDASLSNAGISDDSNLNLYSYSKSSGIWTPANIISIDKVNKIITADINHFSYYAITGYIGTAPSDLGTPQPGDLLYTLGLFYDGWAPGHVGIYTGEKTYSGTGSASADVKKFGLYNVIEAVSPKVQYSYYNLPNVKEKFENSLSSFGNPFTYMGAREPKDCTLTSEQREEIVSYAESQVGKPYAWAQTIGCFFGMLRGSLVKGPILFNCVGLAEKAYEIAGVNGGEGLVNLLNEESGGEIEGATAALTPAKQYNATKPAVGNFQPKIPIVSFTNLGTSRQNSQIETLSEDGLILTELTSDSSEKNYPRLSPNKNKIIFESRNTDEMGDYISPLCTMNLDGSGLVKLFGTFEMTQPAWSSKDKIAFVKEYGLTVIYLTDFSNLSNREKLTPTSYVEETPSFSPDGNYVIYNSNRTDIVQIDITSKHKTILIPGNFGDNVDNEEPEFSPDGNKIVFSSNRDENNNWDIYLYDTYSKNIKRLTNTSSTEYSPHFSKDGSKIFFASDKDGTYQVYSMNQDGSGQNQLTRGPKNHDFGYY